MFFESPGCGVEELRSFLATVGDALVNGRSFEKTKDDR
jgi:hypothetical protein